jgi:hypothetical protein
MGGVELDLDVEAQLAGLVAQARASTKALARCARSARGVSLEIWGTLPPSWAGSFSLHCFGVGLDIASGLGCRISPAQWAARFELATERPRDVHAFDFLRMARRKPSGAMHAALPRLDAFTLVRHASGGLAAQVRGRDEPGFLAAVLQRFALFELHPDRFVLGSDGDRAVDAFLLRGASAAEPAPADAAALRRALEDCLPPRAL